MKTLLILTLALLSPLSASENVAWFGVATHDNTKGERYLPGVVIAYVWIDSPAAKAGLLEGDVLFSVAGKRPRSPEHLQRLIRRQKAGSTIKLTFHRKGQPQEAKVTLGTAAEAREKGALLTEDSHDQFPIKKPADITPQNAKRVWAMIENDTKLSLLDMGFSPEHVARVLAQMKSAGTELAKIPDASSIKKEK